MSLFAVSRTRRFSNVPIALLGVVAVVSMAKGVLDGTPHRWRAAEARLETRCTEWRAEHGAASDPCSPDGPHKKLLSDYRAAKQRVESARSSIDRGDVSTGLGSLRSALDRAERIDGDGAVVGTLMAAEIVDGVLDVVEPRRDVLGRANVAALLDGRRIASASRPLEGERLARLASIAAIPANLPVPTGPFGRAVAAQAMAENEAAIDEMDRAILARDVGRCRQAAEKPAGLGSAVQGSLCERLVGVRRTAARLERTRAGAFRG